MPAKRPKRETPTSRQGQTLRELGALLPEQPSFAAVLESLKRGQAGAIDGAWGSSAALVVATLAGQTDNPLVVVAPRMHDVDEFADDVFQFLGEAPAIFPAYESWPPEASTTDTVGGTRLRLLRSLLDSDLNAGPAAEDHSLALRAGGPRVIVTSGPAIMQPVPSRAELLASSRTLRVGESLDVDELLRWLIERGFERVPAVELPGEVSMHGGIVDVFPQDADDPLRLEFFGDELESLRRFDVESQRTIETLNEVCVTAWRMSPLASPEVELGEASSESAQTPLLSNYLPNGSWISFIELADLIGEAKQYRERLREVVGLATIETVIGRFTDFPNVTIAAIAADSLETSCHLQVESIERFTGPRTEVLNELASVIGRDEHVLIACHNEGERERLAELLGEWKCDSESGVRGQNLGNEKPKASDTAPETDCDSGPKGRDRTAQSKRPTGASPWVEAGAAFRLIDRVTLCVGRVHRGFRLVAERLIVLSDHELFGRTTVARETKRQRKVESRAIDSFLDLSEGDLVVHLTHGIARYRGMKLMSKSVGGARGEGRGGREGSSVPRPLGSGSVEIGWQPLPHGRGTPVGRASRSDHASRPDMGVRSTALNPQPSTHNHEEEHLSLEFANRVFLYVPVSLIHLVQKYVGAGQASPELSVVGGTAWARRKQRAAAAVADLASDMLLLQAARETKPGTAYPPDSHWMQEFEAAFPYEETPDQHAAIGDCKADLEMQRPMDRLICGDVGYGKTEVAMRAAFKVLDAGKQVAVLVPTTVLCEQHFRTFSERLAEFPFNIANLSRFKTKGEQKQVLQGLESGGVDIVIGTHRVVQPDVRFKDLGLLVIDEEQRFGVEHKELLKRLRLEVDVLTLSATPIPRTLHMSLLGIRDISNLTTAPVDRMAVTTRVCRFDPELIRQAIVRELNRNGQVYFVHNRVYNIQLIADQIQRIVPEARIGIGHGQMSPHELEEVMLKFVNCELDVLVATTIIESGLDIPNANTIFIHQADNYGLADLHQLRGRVGRYKHKAYCYLLLEEGKSLTPLATKRLKAIEEFSELGAGFKIAMRDLEIRGAGNILGTEQSGHIEAIGYELYCQLLENAVRSAKRMPPKEHIHVQIDLPFSAFLPHDYVPPGRPKIEAYRRLSAVGSFDELTDWQSEMRDRFGPIPSAAERLVELRELQLLASRWNIDRISRENDFLVFQYRDAHAIRRLSMVHKGRLRIVDAKSAYWPLNEPGLATDDLISRLKMVLLSN